MNPSELSDRELDAAVAKEVMGWVPDHDGGPVWLRYVEGVGAADTAWIGDFWPSTDPRAMMEVIGRMQGLGYRDAQFSWEGDKYNAFFANYPGNVSNQRSGSALHEKLPRAVAEAALLAVRAQKGEGDEK